MPYFPQVLKDPQLALSKKEQNLLLGRSSSAWLKKPRNLIIYIGSLAIWITVFTGANILLGKFNLDSTLIVTILWIVFFLLLFIVSHYIIFHVGFLPHFYKELRGMGKDICLECGYILINLPESEINCPECGIQRTPLPELKIDL